MTVGLLYCVKGIFKAEMKTTKLSQIFIFYLRALFGAGHA